MHLPSQMTWLYGMGQEWGGRDKVLFPSHPTTRHTAYNLDNVDLVVIELSFLALSNRNSY